MNTTFQRTDERLTKLRDQGEGAESARQGKAPTQRIPPPPILGNWSKPKDWDIMGPKCRAAVFAGSHFLKDVPDIALWAAGKYVDIIKMTFSPSRVVAAIMVGNDVCAAAGGLREGAAAIRAVYVVRFGITTTLEGLAKLEPNLDENLVNHLKKMIQEGVPANFSGPRGVRNLGPPYKSATEGSYLLEYLTKM